MDKLLVKLLTLSKKKESLEKYMSLLKPTKTDTSLTLSRLMKHPEAYTFYKENLPEKDILLAEFCMKLKMIYKSVNKYLTQIALYPSLTFENNKLYFNNECIILNLKEEESNLVLQILKYKEYYLHLKMSNKKVAEKLCRRYEEIVLNSSDLLDLFINFQDIYFEFDNLCIFTELGLEIQFDNLKKCYLKNEFTNINKEIELLDLDENDNCLGLSNENILLEKGFNIQNDLQNFNESLLVEQNFTKILYEFDKILTNSSNKFIIRNSLLMDESVIYAFQCKIQEAEKEKKERFTQQAENSFKRIKDTILFNRSDFIQTLFVLLRESAYKNKRSFFYILESAYTSCFKKFKSHSLQNKLFLPKEIKKINFESEESEMNLDIQIEEKDNQWNYLTLIPMIKYPLTLFISQEEVNKLVYIFKILYRIKKTENHLTTLRFKSKNNHKILTIRFTDFILRLNSFILFEIIELNYKIYKLSFINKIRLFFNEKKLAKLLVSIEEFCLNVSKNKKFECVDYVKEFLEDIQWEEGMFFKYCKWYLDN